MGFIPIFVALLGLIIIYSIYTYNLIKPRKARLTQVIDQMAANATQRKQAILAYDAQNENASLADAAAQLKRTSTDRFQSYKKEEELIDVINQGLTGLTDESLKADLQKANSTQEQLMKQLKNYAGDYNRMIGKAPASAVASVFGFKQF
ncbi:hypothetical protein BXY85_0352 [Roseivirga pacifica]|uniref:LemA family protein n=1 Tax=Roseivirga pacifica TaxID=1267423 RepID=A0A1I0RC35_9BACT|nr:hypothetical protein [Roseivirga pacifica]RKQ49363.1 hypothetical protein BXY85_0352 [Roseivirga pacifica]SEW38335.1 hypothetical protein SAMN05216290_3405 [Roseivirga pacifica]